MHTRITDLYRDINSVFVGARENAADRVLRSSKFEQDAEGGVRDQYRYVASNSARSRFSMGHRPALINMVGWKPGYGRGVLGWQKLTVLINQLTIRALLYYATSCTMRFFDAMRKSFKSKF